MKIESMTNFVLRSTYKTVTDKLGWIFMMSMVTLSAGCGSAVLRSDAAAKYGNVQLHEPATVQVVVTDEARRKRHFPESLSVPDVQALIERQLAEDGLLVREQPSAAPRILVEITDARIRSRWVATMWGFMAGTDRIHARVMLLDPNGRKMNYFNVMTSYAFGGIVGGATSIRVPWVYEEFAGDVVGALTGKTDVKRARPDDPSARELRRLRF